MIRHHIKAILVIGVAVIFGIYGFQWFQSQKAKEFERGVVEKKSYPAAWTPYGTDNEGNRHFYKVDPALSQSPGFIKVWTQVLYSPAGKGHYIATRQKSGLPTQGYDRFSHRNVLYEVNCLSEKKEFYILEVFELTPDGKTLDYAKAGTYKDWAGIPDGSIYGVLHATVCPEKKTVAN
ncbi:MAG: hypothetical protein A4E62_01698 [Syntrophorhabdus sp. PtaU1.Bin002]|nr:MAG: hypothetical protein A4E62_01698 [Syntrophorhabdus sp. PtaU1.Bin002]